MRLGAAHRVGRQDRIRVARHRGARIDPNGRGAEQHRRIGPGIRDRLGAHRPSIHKRDGEARQHSHRRILGQHAALRVLHGDLARRDRARQRGDAREHVAERREA